MHHASLHGLISWLSMHHEWIVASVFLVSLLESLAIVGLLVPGIFILFAISGLAGGGSLPLWKILLVASLGSFLGDSFSFMLGFFAKDRPRKWWPFTRYPYWLTNAEKIFSKDGEKAVLIARFVGPLRPFMPLVAGMLKMPAWKFYCTAAIGALFWAPLYIIPGFFTGASIQWHNQLPELFITLLLSLAFASVLLALLAVHVQRKVAHKKNFAASLSIIFFSTLLAILAVLSKLQKLDFINQLTHLIFTTIRTPVLEQIMSSISNYADRYSRLIYLIFIPAILWLFRQRTRAMLFTLAIILNSTLVGALAILVASPRPLGAHAAGFSFPSGHTGAMCTLCFTLALFFAQQRRKINQIIIWSLALFLSFLMGFARMILDQHWLFDVIAGFISGSMCVAMISLRLPTNKEPALPLLIACGISIGVVSFWIHYTML